MAATSMTAETRGLVLTRAARVERLYARHRDRVFRLALRYGAGDVAWAEDVTHDVFVRLLGVIDRLVDEDDLAGWFYRVTTNQCLKRLERDRIRSSLMAIFPLLSRTTPTPEAAILARSDLERTMDVVRSLPGKERVAFLMLHLDGKSQNEIARIMGHSKGYVSKLLRRASDRVRSAGYEVPE
jgi:RNA polymerase sigma-70 factor, ECF subfamily